MARQGIRIRKVADKSAAVEEFNHATGETVLTNPHGDAWPLKGIQIEGDKLKEIRVPTSWVSRGINEGWLSLENQKVVRCPGGPAEDPKRKIHTFFQGERIVLKTLDGDVAYKVVSQPGKFVKGDDGKERLATEADVKNKLPAEVRWYFDADLES